jgi:RecA-family ATPase
MNRTENLDKKKQPPSNVSSLSPLSLKLQEAVMNIANVFESEPPELDFVWPGFLSETVGALCAAGSTGKSYWAIEAAMCVASRIANELLLNLEIKTHGKVLILSAEDGLTVLTRRMHFIGRYLTPEARKEVAENIIVIPVVGWGVNINDPDWTESIIKLATGTRLVVLDTHSRWSGGANENDNAEQAAVVMQYERVAAKAKTAVLFLHHVGKQSMFAGKQDEQGAARGASAIIDNARWQGYMQTMTKDIADEYGIDVSERSQYVASGAGKQNHGVKSDEPTWYKRHEEGVLLPVILKKYSLASKTGVGRTIKKKIQAVPGIDVAPGALERVLRTPAPPVDIAAVIAANSPLGQYGG